MSTTSKTLRHIACFLAIVGGLCMMAAACLTTASIVGRWLWAKPIPGDVELVQFSTAFCISLCLPWCQLHKGNIIVDFFTEKASNFTRRLLDAVGEVLLAAMMALLCWRTLAGGVASYDVGETTIILGLPMWLLYLVLAPGLLTTAIIAVCQAAGIVRVPQPVQGLST